MTLKHEWNILMKNVKLPEVLNSKENKMNEAFLRNAEGQFK
jgi:hypothetical protein